MESKDEGVITALDKRLWRSVLTGWTYLTTKDDQGKVILKPEVSWSFEDDKLANYNFKALHTIFNGVDANHIILIVSHKFAKKA